VVAQEQLPDPPAFVDVTPRTPRGYVEIPLPTTAAPAPQLAVVPPPAAEPERPRYLLDRLFQRTQPPPAAAAEAAPAPTPAPAPAPVPVRQTVPQAQPVISAQAAARAKAASDMAKAQRERAQERAMQENRARERAFFNSSVGVNSRY
jgi:hypothetical protein